MRTGTLVSQKTKVYNMTICGLFAALIAVGAFIKVPVPVVPFTLQFLFTNLAGIVLGRKWGTLSVVVYIAVGLAGMPVFAAGGGIGYVLQPSFGYLIGFAVGTFVGGLIVDISKNKNVKTMFIAGFVNLMIVYAVGMVYYYMISRLYLGSDLTIKTLIIYCFLLAVPGDIVLCIVSSGLGKTLRKAYIR